MSNPQKPYKSLRSEIFLGSHFIPAVPSRLPHTFFSPIRRLHYRKNKITLLMCSVSQFLSEGAVRRRYRTDSPSIISFFLFSLSHTLIHFPFFLLLQSPFCWLSYLYEHKICVHLHTRFREEFSKCQIYATSISTYIERPIILVCIFSTSSDQDDCFSFHSNINNILDHYILQSSQILPNIQIEILFKCKSVNRKGH